MSKILVIEDSHVLRNDIIELLGLEGFDVAGAENGMQGVQMAREFQPDMIICDIMMPELDGYGVLEALRKDPQTETIPFIFMTAKTDKSDIRLGMGLGADDYLTKPFLTSELLKAIRARLTRHEVLAKHADRRLDELRESIITALPHEFRTPLNAIVGFSEMLIMEGHTAEQVVEWADHINRAAQRLYHLIENYLAYVRIETLARDPQWLRGLSQLRVEDPGATIEFCVVQQTQQARRDGDLTLDIHEVPAIRMAEQDLSKIVTELLDNAFKFSEPGTPIEVGAWVDGGDYVLSITNYGQGMTREQIDAIGAYMQFDRWLYEQQGMGFGLAIARRLAQLVGGALTIDSTPLDKTTVQVRIPLAH